eukprot:GEMP01053072.1.p1 GENE.GEMP01053072.1~~GEMP01053072.1.p1  ORF type:complete len:149 (-),score=16.36 GEMP01053072.1:237-683(-)
MLSRVRLCGTPVLAVSKIAKEVWFGRVRACRRHVAVKIALQRGYDGSKQGATISVDQIAPDDEIEWTELICVFDCMPIQLNAPHWDFVHGTIVFEILHQNRRIIAQNDLLVGEISGRLLPSTPRRRYQHRLLDPTESRESAVHGSLEF